MNLKILKKAIDVVRCNTVDYCFHKIELELNTELCKSLLALKQAAQIEYRPVDTNGKSRATDIVIFDKEDKVNTAIEAKQYFGCEYDNNEMFKAFDEDINKLNAMYRDDVKKYTVWYFAFTDKVITKDVCRSFKYEDQLTRQFSKIPNLEDQKTKMDEILSNRYSIKHKMEIDTGSYNGVNGWLVAYLVCIN